LASNEDLYCLTIFPDQSDAEDTRKAIELTEILAAPSAPSSASTPSKNYIIGTTIENASLLNAVLSQDPRWVVDLLINDMKNASSLGSRAPDGYMALSCFLLRGNNHVWSFRTKNWLACDGFVAALLQYGHYFAKSKHKQTSLLLWRSINAMVTHPVCATIFLSKLYENKLQGNGQCCALLSDLMTSEDIPDDVQGLVFQTVVIVQEQCDQAYADGVDRQSVLNNLVPKGSMYEKLLSSFARPMALQYISNFKTR